MSVGALRFLSFANQLSGSVKCFSSPTGQLPSERRTHAARTRERSKAVVRSACNIR
jgi:hypothetical protein